MSKQNPARDKRAAEYFVSGEFIRAAGYEIEAALYHDESCIRVPLRMHAGKQDIPSLQQSFNKLKEQCPDIDHFHISNGWEEKGDCLFIDTKPLKKLGPFTLCKKVKPSP